MIFLLICNYRILIFKMNNFFNLNVHECIFILFFNLFKNIRSTWTWTLSTFVSIGLFFIRSIFFFSNQFLQLCFVDQFTYVRVSLDLFKILLKHYKSSIQVLLKIISFSMPSELLGYYHWFSSMLFFFLYIHSFDIHYVFWWNCIIIFVDNETIIFIYH